MVSLIYQTKPFNVEAARNGALCVIVPREDISSGTYSEVSIQTGVHIAMPDVVPEEPVVEVSYYEPSSASESYDYYTPVGNFEEIPAGDDEPNDGEPSTSNPVITPANDHVPDRIDFIISPSVGSAQQEEILSREFIGIGKAAYKDETFTVKVGDVSYLFDKRGNGIDVISSQFCLKLVDAQSVNGEASTRADDDVSGYVTDLELVDEVALKMLPVLLNKLDSDVVELNNSDMLYYCQKAYQWADNILYTATKRRGEASQQSNGGEQNG